MEIKAVLQKPYTGKQKDNFICNYQYNYEIRETETELQAWGKDEQERLEDLKNQKYKDNETIREQFLVSGVEYKDILWDSDIEQKLNISIQVSSMGDEDVVKWVAMDGVTSLECTKADLLAIGELLTKMTAYVWQFKNPAIKTAIANAQTIEELEEIQIVYDLNEINEIEEPTIEPEPIEE